MTCAVTAKSTDVHAHPTSCLPAERFAEVQAAYAVVGDSQQRPMYDAWLNSGLAISYKYVRPRVRCGSFA